MEFNSISIKQAVLDIERDKYFLPPIQRNFIWDNERVINLFDSIYRDYPIGNCIFWKIKSVTSQRYPLYKFVREFYQKTSRSITNEGAPSNLLLQDVFAVVDGQQRLSSLFIGLAGTFKRKKGGSGTPNIETNFVPTKLYINLLTSEVKESSGKKLFAFFGENESPMNQNNLWFEVGQVIRWKNLDEAALFVKKILEPRVLSSNKKTLTTAFNIRKARIVEILNKLFKMVNDKRLYYFEIDKQDLDKVVDIFIRVNSGGITLKKSDLLFSVLVSQWNEGRDEIKNLCESMKESGVSIPQDFIMRSCLVLSDLPVKYKLESFTIKNINIIKRTWPDIKKYLMKLCELLPEIGYNDDFNQSDNALIPIAYYLKKGGSYNTLKSKKILQKYYVISQVMGIFGGQSDQTLEKIRAEIKKQLENDNILDYQKLVDLKLPGGKTFELTLTDLEELVQETTYHSPHAYFLLSLIYPVVDFKIRRYQVDHIHPKGKFNKANLRRNGIEDELKIDSWVKEKKDLLSNLELLGKDNQAKSGQPIIEFLKSKPKREQKEFMKENILPTDFKLLELKYFEKFLTYRKRKLVNKLKKHFGIIN